MSSHTHLTHEAVECVDLSQTAVFGADAEKRAHFDTRGAFEAAWNQCLRTAWEDNEPAPSLIVFRAGFLAALYYSANTMSRTLGK